MRFLSVRKGCHQVLHFERLIGVLVIASGAGLNTDVGPVVTGSPAAQLLRLE